MKVRVRQNGNREPHTLNEGKRKHTISDHTMTYTHAQIVLTLG